MQPEVLACLEQRRDQRRGHRPRTRPGSPARFDRFDSECSARTPSCEPPQTSGCSTDTGRVVPTQLDVALVGDDHGAALARPGRPPCAGARLAAPAPSGCWASSPTPGRPARARPPSSSRTTTTSAPTTRAPTSYVGYASSGTITRLLRPQPEQQRQRRHQLLGADRRQDGVASRLRSPRAGAPSTPTAAARSVSVPCDGRVAGGVGGARASARCTTSGTGSTGVPTDRSTMPSGCADARGLARRRAGPTGSRGAGRASGDGAQLSTACGGRAATIGWSFSILPILAAPPGEPRSSKNSTLAL